MRRAECRRIEKAKRKSGVPGIVPFSNMEAQHMALQFHATRQQLEEMGNAIRQEAWEEGEEWSNIVNTVTMMMAINELYGWGARPMLKIVNKSNEYVEKANRGERTILDMIDELSDKHGIEFDEKHRELVKRYGL